MQEIRKANIFVKKRKAVNKSGVAETEILSSEAPLGGVIVKYLNVFSTTPTIQYYVYHAKNVRIGLYISVANGRVMEFF